MLGPYGNRFHLHVAPDDLRHALGTAGRPGSEKSTCVGMDALTLEVLRFERIERHAGECSNRCQNVINSPTWTSCHVGSSGYCGEGGPVLQRGTARVRLSMVVGGCKLYHKRK